MKRNLMMTTMSALAISALAMASPISTPQAQAETSPMETLREMEREVAAIAEHAAKLEQMMDMPNTYSHSAHEFEWNMIDARFDEAGKKIPTIQGAADLEPWKKEIVDEIAALLAAMGKQIESGSKILTETAAVERLAARNLYPLRIQAVYDYAQMIDNHIEAVQEWHEPTS